ncbi:MAG TPA: UvrD-helicase domain-containing protein [Acidobacteriaceae bacterium]|nr:UvrD-helicase domain-containing protein [Acidobacteriaceae bacterium]
MSKVLRFPSAAPANDAAAREAALDIRQSCIVEAPAGSGKTGLLMQRYLKLLAQGDVAKPEEVLAITFTNKATAELHERVFAQLVAAQNSAPPTDDFELQTRTLAEAVLARDAALNWHILDHPQSLNIRTIDSVCAEIASSLPLLSGSGGSGRPTTDAGPLYRLAAERTLFQLGGTDTALHNALRNVLLRRDASLTEVQSLLADMLQQRDQWADFLPLGPDALDEEALDRVVRAKLERTLETIVCSALTRAANAMPAGMLHQLAELAAQLGLNPGYNGADSPIAFCADRRTPPEDKADHLDHWQALISLLLTKEGDWRKSFSVNHIKFEMSKSEKVLLQNLIDAHKSDELCDALCAVRNLPDARYPDDQWAVAKALFHVLRRALAELKLIFAESNGCDFIEIALAARQALNSEGASDDAIDLALSAGGKLRHLLVDEMQDTSATQYDLIHQLTRSWDGATQTLFLVGDPKQSIYLFRQARVERFLRTMHEARFGDIRLQALRLTSNFRSQASLVHAFNATFERIFPPPDAVQSNSSDVPFVAAVPNRLPSPTDDITWHTAVLGEEELDVPRTKDDRRDHDQQQARNIRSIIEHWLATPLPADREKPWRIAVLARARKHLDAVVTEFKRDYGSGPLRYRAVDIDPLSERPEIFDVLALTRTLLHPADRPAWLAVLHAPWCGLSLADLLALTDEGPTADPCATVASLVVTRTQHLSAEGQQLLARAWPVLQTAVSTLGHAPFATQIERTWRSLGGDAPLTPEERNNVMRFLAALRDVHSDLGYLDFSTLTARLDRLYAEPISGPCSVELLTIHKAKGLEWDIVLVPSLERRGGSSSGDLLNWLEVDSPSADTSGVVLAPIASKGSDNDRLNRWLNAAREARENSERKRLFYVLGTRAREELHLFAACARKTDGSLAAPQHGSLLKAVWPAAAEAFAPLQAPPATSLAHTFQQSLIDDHEPLALAAAAETAPDKPPNIHRLPLSFNPDSRFETAAANRLPYTPAAALRHGPTFERPEGSYAVRAFGNVVHRYLQVLSARLEQNPDATALQQELPTWLPRLTASLRSEGLAPATLDRLAQRSLQALQRAIADETGLWILRPHATSHSEQALRTTSADAGELRIDRVFLAGPTPLSEGASHLWIVDFKTTEQGSRSPELFVQQEKAKYAAQLENYAGAQIALQGATTPVIQGLYYPLIPSLICW